MTEYTQENRFIAIHTPLGEDALLLQGFTGQEGISRLFSFDVHLLSENSSISFDKIVGQNVTITVTLPDSGEERYVNGFIIRFAQGGDHGRLSSYRAEIIPWLGFLTRATDCRGFQSARSMSFTCTRAPSRRATSWNCTCRPRGASCSTAR